MQKFIGTHVGKLVQRAVRIGSGGGQALPGLIVEKLFPGYFAAMLNKLPEGVIIITGTNGKTTTTKMVVELLRSQNKKVITNPTGSNLTRGIISSLIEQADHKGRLPFDMAVFEVDEAYAKQFVQQVRPRWVLALNVSRDQLDRFGEVDAIAELVRTTMCAAVEGVVTNANDPRLSVIGRDISKGENDVKVEYFGVHKSLRKYFPTDNEIVAIDTKHEILPAEPELPSVLLQSFKNQTAVYSINGKLYPTTLQVTGQHNFQNAAAAIALACHLLPTASTKVLVERLSTVGIAFGRGQIFKLRDKSSLQLVLVKNPASFNQTLASYLTNSPSVMVAINDDYADSRDVSWLWDVDFTTMTATSIEITSGSRATDMALRLHYDNIEVKTIEPNLNRAITAFCKLPGNKLVIATYTAMLHLHAKLEKDAGKIL